LYDRVLHASRPAAGRLGRGDVRMGHADFFCS
jgi:hypothetical protein